MNDIYGWKCGWKVTMDEKFHEHSQQVLFCEKLNKKIGYKKFTLVYCEQFVAWNVQVILELVFQIPLLSNIL
jgi:hypothetical protein